MDGRPCALFILDESACILSRCGEPQTLAQLAALGFRDGSYCAESIIGTCALSLAAMQGQPINTAGDRHFKQALQPWSFARRRCLITTGGCSALFRFAVWSSTSPAPTSP